MVLIILSKLGIGQENDPTIGSVMLCYDNLNDSVYRDTNLDTCSWCNNMFSLELQLIHEPNFEKPMVRYHNGLEWKTTNANKRTTIELCLDASPIVFIYVLVKDVEFCVPINVNYPYIYLNCFLSKKILSCAYKVEKNIRQME